MADALVTVLGAASMFGSNVSKNDFGVLDGTSSCACVVMPIGFKTEWQTFGGSKDRTFEFRLEVYLIDTGDPQSLLDRMWFSQDSVIDCLEDFPTLLDTAQDALCKDGVHVRNAIVESGGAAYIPFDFTVQATEIWD